MKKSELINLRKMYVSELDRLNRIKELLNEETCKELINLSKLNTLYLLVRFNISLCSIFIFFKFYNFFVSRPIKGRDLRVFRNNGVARI